MVSELIHVDSPNVSYSGDKITVNYEYATSSVRKIENRIVVSDKRIALLVLLFLLDANTMIHCDTFRNISTYFVTFMSVYRFLFSGVFCCVAHKTQR